MILKRYGIKVSAGLAAFVYLIHIILIPLASAQVIAEKFLPLASEISAFVPAQLSGLRVNVQNPFVFDFIINKGEGEFETEGKKHDAYKTLVEYFLAALTIPDENQWVNLSPYESERIVDLKFGATGMGQDLLQQDYVLKQLVASLTSSEGFVGKKFWSEVYRRVWEEYGTTDVPLGMFNKVWIVPSKSVVFQRDNLAMILESYLKIMMDRDYFLTQKFPREDRQEAEGSDAVRKIGEDVFREMIVPLVEKAVNTSKDFVVLRQITTAMILATWYKQELKASLLDKSYVDKAKVKGVDKDPARNQLIWKRYVDLFRNGVSTAVREDYDVYSRTTIPRKYFSGGFQRSLDVEVVHGVDSAQRAFSDRRQRSVFDQTVVLLKVVSDDYEKKLAQLPSEVQSMAHVRPRAMVEFLWYIKLFHPTIDDVTFRHVLRVAEFSYRLGRHLHLSDEDLVVSFAAGLIHDMGKVDIPEEILKKPGRLTDDEMNIMKTHVEKGMKYFKDFKAALGEVAVKHHEKLNGLGYPAGMNKEDIDFLSQIIAVVDIFEALTSSRHYKAGMSSASALEILRKTEGLNPVLVALLGEIVSRKSFKLAAKRIDQEVEKASAWVHSKDVSVGLAEDQQYEKENVGGIAFVQAESNLQIKHAGRGVFQFGALADMSAFNIDGLIPQIISVDSIDDVLECLDG